MTLEEMARRLASLETMHPQALTDRLFAEALVGLSEAQHLAYVSHVILRFMDWSVRRGRTDEINLWLDHADVLLR